MARYAPDYALPPVDETAVRIYTSSISNEGNKRSELKVQLMWRCYRNINLVQVFNRHNVEHVLVVGNYFIRAKRVSNCYMQEKKKLTVCLYA